MTAVSAIWAYAFGALGLVALVPVVWAIADVLRRPRWQIGAGRKVLWTILMGVGWFLFWPLAAFYSIFYLVALRRRFPPIAPSLPTATWDPYGPGAGGRPPDLPAAGWFTDPSGQPGERWWDGRGWTGLVRPPTAGPPELGQPQG